MWKVNNIKDTSSPEKHLFVAKNWALSLLVWLPIETFGQKSPILNCLFSASTP